MSANTPSAPSPGSPDHHAALLRKTPRQARADQTLRTIYEATAQILQAQGLAGLSTNSVAELAGYAVGTVYQYFENKESLLLAMAMHELNEVARASDAALDAASRHSLPDTLRQVVRSWLNAFDQRQQAQHLIMQAVMSHDTYPLFQQRVVAMAEHLGRRLAELPQAGPPLLPPLSPVAQFVLTRALTGVIRSGVQERSAWLASGALEDELVTLLLALLRPGCPCE